MWEDDFDDNIWCDDDLPQFSSEVPWEEDFTWTTLKGECLKIWEMTDNHLINTIKFLHRKNKHNIFINYEAARRGLIVELPDKDTTKGFGLSLGMDDPNEGYD